MSFKRKQARPQRANGKGKKAISESTVNSQRIGITLKLEAIKKTFLVQGQSLNQSINLHFIFFYLFKPSIWITLGLKTNLRPRVSEIEGFGYFPKGKTMTCNE